MGKPHRRFDEEFEAEAVRLVEMSGRTQREISEDLGIGLSTLRRRRNSPYSVCARSSASVRAAISPGRSVRPAADSATTWCCWRMFARPLPVERDLWKPALGA